jgi:hypothetical protein
MKLSIRAPLVAASVFVSALSMVLAAAPAMASPITYTEVGTGSGSLDGISFTNQLVTITMTADTSNITQRSPTFFENFGTTSITVSTAGTDTLTNPVVFVNQTFSPPTAGFTVLIGTLIGPSVMDTLNSTFATYALGAIGPTSGASFINPGFAFATGSGTFSLSSMGDTTFTATAGVSAIPLPAAFPLFATGLGALGLLAWRRKRKADAA